MGPLKVNVFSFGGEVLFFVFSRMRSEGFPFISWGSGGWRCVRRSWLERPQSFAMVRNRSRCRRLALSLGEALAGDFL